MNNTNMAREGSKNEKPFNPPTGPRAFRNISTNLPPSTSTTSPSTAMAEPATILPPGMTEARKIRINNDLIRLFKKPCPPPNPNGSTAPPIMKGIGLYTHIAAPIKEIQFPHERYLRPAPVFLPIGGPRRGARAPAWAGMESQMSDEVREVWEEVKRSVEEEEKIVANRAMTAEELKIRYGGLSMEDGTRRVYGIDDAELTQEVMSRLQLQDNDGDTAMQIDSVGDHSSAITPTTPGSTGRRPSWGYAKRRYSLGGMNSSAITPGSEKRGRTERRSSTGQKESSGARPSSSRGESSAKRPSAERRGSTGNRPNVEMKGSAVKVPNNMYEVDRDPRKRGR